MSGVRTGRPNGRPRGLTPLTPEQIEQLVGSLTVGAGLALAAKVIGISRSGLRNLMNDNEALRERIDDARAIADDVVEKTLYKLATDGKNPLACLAWLHNRRPLEWRQRREFFDAPGSSEPVQIVFKFPESSQQPQQPQAEVQVQ